MNIYTTLLATLLVIVSAQSQAQVAFDKDETTINISIADKPFTTFYFGDDWAKPFLHPLRTSDGREVTRGFPVTPREGESNDHIWHRGMLFGHADINGVDFWREKSGDEKRDKKLPFPIGRIVCDPISVEHDVDAGALSASYRLIGPGEKDMGGMSQEFRFSHADETQIVDVTTTLLADNGPLVFGDTEEGTFSIRFCDPLREDKGATLRNSEGGVGTKKIWGKNARWINYGTDQVGKPMSVTIMDHPKNLRHPTWWHARGYGLCNANPFGERDFTRDKKRNGKFEVEQGESLSLRYRVMVHVTMPESKAIDELWEEFAGD